jgi:hypothetical protein
MYVESIQGHALVGRFVKESIGCKEESFHKWNVTTFFTTYHTNFSHYIIYVFSNKGLSKI